MIVDKDKYQKEIEILKYALNRKDRNITVLFYSHDTLGLGHLQRNLKIARVLKSVRADLKITLLTGSVIASYFRLPPGINLIPLPPVRKTGKEKYDSYSPEKSFESVLSSRKTAILNAVKDISPDIFWVDHAPVGMKGELCPALEWICEKNRSMLTILGLRDIIDSPSNIIPLWERQGIFDILRSCYDRIFIYGDPRIFDLTAEYGLTSDITGKTVYAGYITNTANGFTFDSKETALSSKRRVFVTIGGGEWVGETIIGSLLRAFKKLDGQATFDTVIVTGPFFPDQLWSRYSEEAKGIPIKMHKFVIDTRPSISASDMVVSTAGYNTVTDVLGYGKRSLLIPRMKFRHEQFLRSERFVERGIAEMLHPDKVTSRSLVEKIMEMLGSEKKPVETARQNEMIDLNGSVFLSDYIKCLIPAR